MIQLILMLLIGLIQFNSSTLEYLIFSIALKILKLITFKPHLISKLIIYFFQSDFKIERLYEINQELNKAPLIFEVYFQF